MSWTEDDRRWAKIFWEGRLENQDVRWTPHADGLHHVSVANAATWGSQPCWRCYEAFEAAVRVCASAEYFFDVTFPAVARRTAEMMLAMLQPPE